MTGDQILGLIMLFGMITVIFVGFPISFTLLFLGLVFGCIGLGAELTFNLAYLQIWGTMKDEVFPAVPLFIFMGFMTEQAGLMERLFAALRNLLAPVRGSLYLAVILTATVFAMATGIVGAAVTVLGIMAAPMMIKAGYDARLSAGAIAAGGTLGILIPPSVMLVVMGPTMGVPVNLLYSAAFGPGFLLAGMYIVYTLGRSFFIKAARSVDARLDRICRSFDFLLSVSPINTGQAYEQFRADKWAKPPDFRYRPLTVDPSEAKNALYRMDLKAVEDPVLETLFSEKRQEVDLRQLILLIARVGEKVGDNAVQPL